ELWNPAEQEVAELIRQQQVVTRRPRLLAELREAEPGQAAVPAQRLQRVALNEQGPGIELAAVLQVGVQGVKQDGEGALILSHEPGGVRDRLPAPVVHATVQTEGLGVRANQLDSRLKDGRLQIILVQLLGREVGGDEQHHALAKQTGEEV